VVEEQRIRLVVIDDDLDICEVLRVVATHHPSIEWIGSALSPEEAVPMCRASRPDAILLDHHFMSAEPAEPSAPDGPRRPIRGLSGLEAVEYLRAVAPDAVIAVHTGAAGLGASVMHSGADLYLRKGVDPNTTLDEVAEHIRQRRG